MITKLFLISNLFAIQFCLKEFDIVRRNLPRKFIKTDQKYQNLNLSNFIYTIDLLLGTPSQSVPCVIDTRSFIAWVEKGLDFNSSKSSTFKGSNDQKTINNYVWTTFGNVSSDIVSIFDKKIEFKFLDGYTDTDVQEAGLVGFGRVFNNDSQSDPSYSLMNLLISAKLIKKNIFAVKYINSTNGKFILGDYPEEVKLNPNKYTTMRVNLDGYQEYFWNGYLSHILKGDVYNFSLAQKFGQWVIFDTGSNLGSFPIYKMKKFFVDLFKNMTHSGLCQWTSSFGSRSLEIYFHYICSVAQFDKNQVFPVFNLIFNGWAYKFDTKNLFANETDSYGIPYQMFQIKFSNRLNSLIIGLPLISQYLVVFDNEKDEIGLYGDFRYNFTNYTTDPPAPKKPKKKSSTTSSSLAGWAIALIVIGCIVGLAIIIFIIYCVCLKKSNVVQSTQYSRN